MRHQAPLEVKPVRRYAKPHYPAHDDPDPSAPGAGIPFPYRTPAGVLAITLGLVSTAMAGEPPKDIVDFYEMYGQAVEGLDDGIPAPTAMKSDEYPHPLTIKQSGLPYQSSPYGTGAPNSIHEQQARELINSLFAAEGYNLKPNYHYTNDGVDFIATGYDEQKHVGYIYGTWENLDTDAVLNWSGSRVTHEPITYDPEELLSGMETKWHDKIRQANAKPTEEERQLAYAILVTEYYAEKGKQKLSLEEAKQLEAASADNHEYIAIISQFDRRFKYYPRPNEDQLKRLRETRKIENTEERIAAQQLIHEEFAQEALDNLEKAVRGYLAWVKTQQGY